MSQMLALVTHLAEGDESNQPLQVCGVLIVPLLVAVQPRLAGIADATAIAVVPVGQAAQSVPRLSCEQVAQGVPPGRAGSSSMVSRRSIGGLHEVTASFFD